MHTKLFSLFSPPTIDMPLFHSSGTSESSVIYQYKPSTTVCSRILDLAASFGPIRMMLAILSPSAMGTLPTIDLGCTYRICP